MRSASRTPCSPVAVLEMPELATSACATPPAVRSRVSVIEGPTIALRVKTPATAQGVSEARMPRSKRGSGP